MYQYADKGKSQSETSKANTSVTSKSSVQAGTKMPVQTKSLFSFLRAPESGENQNAEQRLPKPAHAQPNNTGIPTQMKERFENLSGFSFDDVKVHYNSSKPAQLQALAYTQGNQVHIAPGQEKHLGHELGHVVQQKAGKVLETHRVGNVPINNNHALEHEADIFRNSPLNSNQPLRRMKLGNRNVAQLMACCALYPNCDCKKRRSTAGKPPIKYGAFHYGETEVRTALTDAGIPLGESIPQYLNSTTLRTNIGGAAASAKWEAHHIIPGAIVRDNKLDKSQDSTAELSKNNFDEHWNGIMLPVEAGFEDITIHPDYQARVKHANHPTYSNNVATKIGTTKTESHLKTTANDIRTAIKRQDQSTEKDINKLFVLNSLTF